MDMILKAETMLFCMISSINKNISAASFVEGWDHVKMISVFRIMSIFDLGPARSLEIYLRAKLVKNLAHICAVTRYPVKLF